MKNSNKGFIMMLATLSLVLWMLAPIPTVCLAEDGKTPKHGAMILCVTSSGEDMGSQVDEAFGRAEYFAIVNIETMEAEIIKNTAAEAKRRASIAAVKLLSDKGVDALLTGKVGAKGLAALREAGIKVYQGVSEHDSVEDAVKKFKKGDFEETPAS